MFKILISFILFKAAIAVQGKDQALSVIKTVRNEENIEMKEFKEVTHFPTVKNTPGNASKKKKGCISSSKLQNMFLMVAITLAGASVFKTFYSGFIKGKSIKKFEKEILNLKKKFKNTKDAKTKKEIAKEISKNKKDKKIKEENQGKLWKKLENKAKEKARKEKEKNKKKFMKEACGIELDPETFYQKGLVSFEENVFLKHALPHYPDQLLKSEKESVDDLISRISKVVCGAPNQYKDPSYVFKNAYDVVFQSTNSVNVIHASGHKLDKATIYIITTIIVLLLLIIAGIFVKIFNSNSNNDLFIDMDQYCMHDSMKASTLPSSYPNASLCQNHILI